MKITIEGQERIISSLRRISRLSEELIEEIRKVGYLCPEFKTEKTVPDEAETEKE